MNSLRRSLSAYVNHGVEPDTRRLLWTARGIALLLGAVRAWTARNANNPGGISYLDIADAYMRGDFKNAINGFWSPLYSLVLGPALKILRPGPATEAAVAHLVNFLIYCAAMVAFEFLLRAVMARAARDQGGAAPRWAWISFGYAAFTWSSLMLIGLVDLSGDLLMAVFVYAAAGIIVRLQDGPVSWMTGAALGGLLALGYLSKAAMFPLSAAFLVIAWLSRLEWRRNTAAVAAAVVAFSIVASPFAIALSRQKGRLTFGDAGTLVYAMYVNGVPRYAHWQGEPAGRGVPVHPDRKIHEHPDVFEYGTPVSGTHPLWYDPSYWYEGLESPVDLRRQLAPILDAANIYWLLLMEMAPEVLALSVLLVWGAGSRWLAQLSAQRFILAYALVPFGMFALLHTEHRFVGGFVVVGLLTLLLTVRVADSVEARRRVATLMVAATVVVGLRVTVSTIANAEARQFGSPNPDYEIATALASMGVKSGDRLGTIGWAFDAYWARLMHTQIIAEVPEPEVPDFWSLTPEKRQEVLDVFGRAGAQWLVAFSAPHTPAAAGWLPIGRTGLYLHPAVSR